MVEGRGEENRESERSYRQLKRRYPEALDRGTKAFIRER